MHQKLSPYYGARQVDRLGEDECDDYANNDYYNLGQGNFPPAEVPVPHPNCLCIQTAVIPKSLDEIGEEIGDWLRGGNNPNLDNCFNNLSKNKDEVAVSKDDKGDIINNKDIEEYNIFKNALGKEAPKTFKDFQEIKYNNINKYKELEIKYKDFEAKNLLKEHDIELVDKISDNLYSVKNYNPDVKDMTQYAKDNLQNKSDRSSMTTQKTKEFIDNAKLGIFDSQRQTIKFMAQDGYSVLNFDNILVTAVP